MGALRQSASLTRPAFDEVLRWESPIQTFFRTTTKSVDLGGIEIPRDAKILLFLASANRDPRKWDDPDRFDVTRRAAGHVAFGAGIHLCVGQMLARLEAEMIIAALAKRVERIDIVGEPRRKLSNSLRHFASLPIDLKPS
jgi:cytochrome P450